MSPDRGFVLINALILVAALSAVAVFLLTRSEIGRARLQAGQDADQLAMGLDAFDAFAMAQLTADTNSIDHLGESWAKPLPVLPLARGSVSGQITGLQGRFNVNWLADPEHIIAHQAFDRLLTRLAIPARTGAAIRSFLRPGGPENQGPWIRLDPPLDPVGGAILSLEQLRTIPQLSDRSFQRLSPFLAALPGDSALNVNTASKEVLAAFLPHLPPAVLIRLLSTRQRQPFGSSAAFLSAVGIEENTEETDDPTDSAPQLSPDLFAVSSNWFRAEATTTLGDRKAQRVTIFQRKGLPRRITIAWRRSAWP